MGNRSESFVGHLFVIQLNSVENITAQYRGFLQTPEVGDIARIPGVELWSSISCDAQKDIAPPPDWFGSESSILGKRMELMLLWQLKNSVRYQVLLNNVQIHAPKETVGELDFLLRDNETHRLVHLEFAYKLYLYNPSAAHHNELWIGPNKKDSLHRKLKKLRERQFNLLQHPLTKKMLCKHGYDVEKIQQSLYLKTQLFLPKDYSEAAPKDINPQAISGIWIHEKQLTEFQEHSFYLPQKINWSIRPVHDVPWMEFNAANEKIRASLQRAQSPLCWIKTPEGLLKQMFVVWW